MYDVRAIGNWFLDRAERDGDELTAMKLQKLAYVSHGWFLGITDQPLAYDPVEAWKWGPVFRSLYREFRDFGSLPIHTKATAFEGGTLEEDRQISIHDYFHESPSVETISAFLDSVWGEYGKYTAAQLSDITHREGTPWHQMFVKMGNRINPYTVIPNNMIAEHYKKIIDERAAATSYA